MSWNSSFSLGLLGLIAILGCGRGEAQTARNGDTSTASVLKASTTAEPSPQANATSPLRPLAAESTTTESNFSEPPTDIAEGDPKKSRTGSPERIAVLTPGGPLLLDVWLTLDGRSHTEVFGEVISDVLDAADTDDDGHPTWQELAGNEEFLAAGAPTNSNAMSDERQAKMWTERFDQLRDGRIQPDEVEAWLGRDTGRRASEFAVRSTRSYFPNVRAASRVWQLLDFDDDGELSDDEIERSPAALLSLDSDDDRTIVPNELIALEDQLAARNTQMIPANRGDSRQAAIRLQKTGDPARLENLLIDLYSPRRNIGPASFPDLVGLFDQLNGNDDDWLDQDELADLLHVDPHVELSVDFDKPDSPNASAAMIKVLNHDAKTLAIGSSSIDRIVLLLPGSRLIVSAHDIAPQGSATFGQQSQVRFMAHDQCDALFEELDSNTDGRLGEREIEFSPERLTQLDATGDRQISSHEMRPTMIVAFLRSEPLGEQSFYRPTSVTTAVADASVPSWFTSADFNADGDVSRREFLGSADQFEKLDCDDDGYLSAADVATATSN